MRNEDGVHWCNACGYHSNHQATLIRHIHSHHMNWEIECKFCKKKVKTPRALKNHIRAHHHSDKMDMKQIMTWHGIN